jgi:hypothetical protein
MWWIRVTPANVKSRGTADTPEKQQGAGEPVDEPARGDTRVIHVPMNEMPCPPKKSRKFRCWRARVSIGVI